MVVIADEGRQHEAGDVDTGACREVLPVGGAVEEGHHGEYAVDVLEVPGEVRLPEGGCQQAFIHVGVLCGKGCLLRRILPAALPADEEPCERPEGEEEIRGVSDFVAKQVEAWSIAGAETVDADKEQEKQVS